MHPRGSRPWLAITVATLAVGSAASAARGQCFPHWQPLDSGLESGGIAPGVSALAVVNDELFVGGCFKLGGAFCRIARWDATQWQPLGLAAGGSVYALADYQGDLIAGGDFQIPGDVEFIARWDGTQWQPLGSDWNHSLFYGAVDALVVHGGELIAGGDFTSANWQPADHIAAWDGAQWRALGSGLTFPGTQARVFALAEYNGDLIAGGYFTQAGGQPANYVARWDGAQWSPLGEGLDDQAIALAVYNGELIAGGSFLHAGGQPANRIARWDGVQWRPLGDGVSGFGLPPASVYSLAVYTGELVAGGVFSMAGGQQAKCIARWDGVQWRTLDSGLSGAGSEVDALTLYATDLVAGGSFLTAGGQPAIEVARWGCPPGQGDMNCDGTLDLRDINPFVVYLSDASAWQTLFPECPAMNGDINGDGTYPSFKDINPFVVLLSGG